MDGTDANAADRRKELEDEIRKLVVARLAGLSRDTGLSIGYEGTFTRDELIRHVREGDEIGKKVEEIQMEGLRYWKEEADV
jgi:hypothetical protein